MKYITLLSVTLAFFFACSEYDDSQLQSDIENLKSRVSVLEQLCKNMNENISSLQTIVAALQKNDLITSVASLPDNAGYTIVFSSGKTTYLNNGTNGHAPVICVRQDTDGEYYWTVDGDWLMIDGDKVKAVGIDGKTPQFKIEDEYWYVTYDDGKSWTKLGKVTSDKDLLFSDVYIRDGFAYFNLADGTVLKVPAADGNSVSAIRYIPEYSDGAIRVTYSVDEDGDVTILPFTIRYQVFPASSLNTIIEKWETGLSLDATVTAPATRSVGDVIPLSIEKVTGADDILSIVVNPDGLRNHSQYSNGYNVALSYENGNNLAVSDYVRLELLTQPGPVIEYKTTDETLIFEPLVFNDIYLDYQLGNEYINGVGRITVYSDKVNFIGSACFNPVSDKLTSISFITPISVDSLSFRNCGLLENVKLSKVNTSNVEYMGGMFEGCRSLTSLDVSSFNTSNVTDMKFMFDYCVSLTNLDLSGFNTSNVTRMDSMFNGCRSLTTLDLSGFDTSNVTSMSWMFHNCSSLTSLDLSKFNTANVKSMIWMFEQCRSLTSLDLSNFNTSNVTSMTYMFDNCVSLTNLDLSGFNTSNVTSMTYMFHNCSSLTSLDLSSFNTSNVTSMSWMFRYCSSLTSLDLSGFYTSNVKSMSRMFSGCSSLTSLDLSSFNTSNVTDMGGMFSGCSSLTSLDVSSFNTSNVTSMGSMFGNCSSLTNLDLSGFDTSNVTDMTFMFDDCVSLTNLDLAGFNTSNVTSMTCMFRNCSSLTALDLSGWDVTHVHIIDEETFKDCPLKTIKLTGCNDYTINCIRKYAPQTAEIIY